MLRYFPLFIVLTLSAVFAWHLLSPEKPERSVDFMTGQALPAISLPALDAKTPFKTENLQGPFLLNIFASWCAACQIEHETLRGLAEDHDLPLYGIAWKDKPENTTKWLERMGNIYDMVGMDRHGEAAIALGLTGAPETYLIDGSGKIVTLYKGALSDTVVQNRFIPAIQELAKDAP